MNILIITFLSIVQGMAELLPISSSAHVIIVEKILGLNPSSPDMTFLIVMLHTGTMFAVLVYFWPRWKKLLSKENSNRLNFIKMIICGTGATVIMGLGLQFLIEKAYLKGFKNTDVENIFGNTWIIGVSLGIVGILIIISGFIKRKNDNIIYGKIGLSDFPIKNSIIIGLVQGLALPFRGFSRSGSTISTSLLLGLSRNFSEEFSFALSIILTPPIVIREYFRLRHLTSVNTIIPFLPGILGMILSFIAGLIAINWLSSWLEKGRWSLFGFYCMIIALFILIFTGMNILK